MEFNLDWEDPNTPCLSIMIPASETETETPKKKRGRPKLMPGAPRAQRKNKRTYNVPYKDKQFSPLTEGFTVFMEAFKHFIMFHPLIRDDSDFHNLPTWSLDTFDLYYDMFLDKHPPYNPIYEATMPSLIQIEFYKNIVFKHLWSQYLDHETYLRLIGEYGLIFYSNKHQTKSDPSLYWLHRRYKVELRKKFMAEQTHTSTMAMSQHLRDHDDQLQQIAHYELFTCNEPLHPNRYKTRRRFIHYHPVELDERAKAFYLAGADSNGTLDH